MKRICIVTWYESPNYGSRLQATGLYRYLETRGYSVCMMKSFSAMDYVALHPMILRNRIAFRLNRKRHQAFFEANPYEISEERKSRLNTYLQDTFCQVTISNSREWKQFLDTCDTFIAGSDIIWQPNNGRPGRMFLDFTWYEKVRRISYASSTGSRVLPKKYYRDYKKLLGKFGAISVREQNTADFFTALLGKPVKKVIDPTLLLPAEEWKQLGDKAVLDEAVPSEPFILCYFVMEDKGYWEYVKKAAEATGYSVCVLPMHELDEKQGYRFLDKGTPYEFLALIQRAEMVITDSFHCSVFSFLFDAEFYVVPRARRDEDEKFSDLLTRYGLKDRRVTDRGRFVRKGDIDYSEGKKVLMEDRAEAERFLEKALRSDIR